MAGNGCCQTELVATLLTFDEEVLKSSTQLCSDPVMRPQVQLCFHGPLSYMLIKTCHFVHITARKKKKKKKAWSTWLMLFCNACWSFQFNLLLSARHLLRQAIS